jgi:hypothetical protein
VPYGTEFFFLIETLVLVLARGLRLLPALDTGALVMLSFTYLRQDACLGAAAFKTLERAVDGLPILYTDLRHLYFPPSRMPGKPQHLRAIIYGFNVNIIQSNRIVVKEKGEKSVFGKIRLRA